MLKPQAARRAFLPSIRQRDDNIYVDTSRLSGLQQDTVRRRHSCNSRYHGRKVFINSFDSTTSCLVQGVAQEGPFQHRLDRVHFDPPSGTAVAVLLPRLWTRYVSRLTSGRKTATSTTVNSDVAPRARARSLPRSRSWPGSWNICKPDLLGLGHSRELLPSVWRHGSSVV